MMEFRTNFHPLQGGIYKNAATHVHLFLIQSLIKSFIPLFIIFILYSTLFFSECLLYEMTVLAKLHVSSFNSLRSAMMNQYGCRGWNFIKLEV